MDLTNHSALNKLKEFAKDTSKIRLSKHARERMAERNISMTQIVCCFEHGSITEGPFKNTYGDWQLNVSVRSAGDFITTTVALCLDEASGEYSVVVTTFKD